MKADEVTARKAVNYILDKDLTTYPSYIQELVKNTDRETLIQDLLSTKTEKEDTETPSQP